PRASVIILAWRNAALLRKCLRALAERLEGHTPSETIVVLNGAGDDVKAVLDDVDGAVVVPSAVNLGFSGGNNLGASVAKGEYLVLLNDDTEVEPGWLEALVRTADANPDAGA